MSTTNTLDNYLDSALDKIKNNPRQTIELIPSNTPSWKTIGKLCAIGGASLAIAGAIPVVAPSAATVGLGSALGGILTAIPGGIWGAGVGGIGIVVGGMGFGIPAAAVAAGVAALSSLPGIHLGALFASTLTHPSLIAMTLTGLGISSLALAGILLILKAWENVKSRYENYHQFLDTLSIATTVA